MNTVSVDAEALRQVLVALTGPPHYVRELQATMAPVEIFPDNPVNTLVSQYNDWVSIQNAETKKT